MAEEYAPVKVKVRTQKQVKILSAVTGKDMHDLVGGLVDALWRDAVKAGLVKNVMLEDVSLPAVEAQS